MYPSFIRKPSPKSAAAIGSWLTLATPIETSQEPLASTVGDLEQERAVALLCLNRSKDAKSAEKWTRPSAARGGVLEIDHAQLCLSAGSRANSIVPVSFFVRSNLTERLASGDDRTIRDRDLGDFGARTRVRLQART